MNFTRLAWANFLLSIVLSHQSFGLVNGFYLLLQGDVGLCCLLGTSHASRVAIPSNLVTQNIQRSKVCCKLNFVQLGISFNPKLSNVNRQLYSPSPLASGFLLHQSSYRWPSLPHRRYRYASQPAVSSCSRYPNQEHKLHLQSACL